jgi:endonuclease/exonuclease/phosphatase family metal-dependent hydrolase
VAGTAILRVVTWNLWGNGAPAPYLRERGVVRGAAAGSRALAESDPDLTWHRRFRLLVTELERIRPHLLLLQENGTYSRGSAASTLAGALGLHAYEDGEPDGLAILSESAPRRRGVVPIAANPLGYPRPLWTEWAVARFGVRALCVHLPLERAGPREPFVAEVAAAASESDSDVTIVGGDLNAPVGDPLHEYFHKAGFVDVSAECGPTMPNPGPVVRLDYVLVRASRCAVSVVSAEAVGSEPDSVGFLASDHLGVAVELRLSVS